MMEELLVDAARVACCSILVGVEVIDTLDCVLAISRLLDFLDLSFWIREYEEALSNSGLGCLRYCLWLKGLSFFLSW